MSGAPGIDQLIATLPDRVQQNQLRQAQTEEEQENIVQNALALRQNIAGQNALRQIYSNPNAINAQTGLPTPQGLSPLFQASPQMGLTMLDTMSKIQDAQSRSNLTNFKLRDEYNNILMDNVVKPINEYNQELQDKGIDPKQRQILLEQKRQELLNNTQAEYALPDSIKDAASNIPIDDTWPGRYEFNQQRQANIQKGWKQETDYGKDPPVSYWRNDFLGITTNSDRTAVYRPTGVGKPAGKPEPIQTDTYKDDKGQTQTKSFTRDQFGKPIDVNTAAPYTIRGQVSSSKATPKPAAAEMVTGPGYGPTLATPPSAIGEPWRDQSGNPLPAPPTNKVPANTQPMSDAAKAYMAERERLGLHMSAAWATSQYLPDMAEQDIRSSLNLPQGAPLSTQDARAAALNDVVTQRGMHADSQALTTIARQNALVQSFEGTAQREANLVEQLGPKGVAGGDQLWNKFRQASRREIGIDPDLGAFDNALTSFKNEYVKIMSTSAGQGGMTSDAARDEGNRLFNTNQPWTVIQKNLDTARQSMSNRVNSIRADYNTTLDAIRDKGVFAQPESVAPGEGTISSKASASNSLPTQKFNSLDDAIKGAPAGKVVSWSGTTFYKDDMGRVHKYVNGAWQ